MKSSIVLLFLVSCLALVTSRPKNSDVIPKDYYKRQILQPIPGYIPVYIQSAEPQIRVKSNSDPLSRKEKTKHDEDLLKVPEIVEKTLTKAGGEKEDLKESKPGLVKKESPVKDPKNAKNHEKL